MANTATGRLLGKIITLDDPLPSLDGKRVRLVLEAAEGPDTRLSDQEQQRLWQQWVEKGEHGPLDDEDEPAFP